VRESRAGGIARFKSRMSRTSGVTFQSHSGPTQNCNPQPTSLLGWTTRTWRAVTNYLSSPVGSLPTYQKNKAATVAPKISVKPAQLRILSSCIESGRKGIALYQDDIADQNMDKLLFPFLSLQYTKHVGRLVSVFSLRTVVGIHSIKVRYYLKRMPKF
jgi:hypothetical protein